MPIVTVTPIVEFGGLHADDAIIKSASDVESDECESVDDVGDVTTMQSLWLRGLGTATVGHTAITLVSLLVFFRIWERAEVRPDPCIIAGCSIFGAFGCGLELVDLQSRLAKHNSVKFPHRLLFGLGLGTLLLVWTFATTKFWLSILVG